MIYAFIGSTDVGPVSEPDDQGGGAYFQKIQRNFISGLPQRLKEIQQAVDNQSRYVALHRLAGAAGGYGFPHMGDMAMKAMRAMQPGSTTAIDECLANLTISMEAVIRSEKAEGKCA
jgi:HPt (histidine-containing phosphotransfer) domain-containing protein